MIKGKVLIHMQLKSRFRKGYPELVVYSASHICYADEADLVYRELPDRGRLIVREQPP